MRRWIPCALGLLEAGSLGLAAAQTAGPQIQTRTQTQAQVGAQVRAEFRTAARSLITQPIDRSRLARVGGALRREVATAQDLGAHDPAAAMEHMQLVLRRPPERQAAFDAEVEALHRRGDPSYHRWLTPETIGAEFGPSTADIATLTAYLAAEGFTVNNVGNSGMSVDFTGTVAQVQQSFHTEIHDLRLANGEQHVSAVRDAQMPEALTPLVAGFLSLSDIAPRPGVVAKRAAMVAQGGAGLQPELRTGAQPNDTEGGEYYVGAQDFYTIYNETPLLNAETNGAGTTVALLEETNIHKEDVTTFRTMMGVSPATPTLNVLHGAGAYSCSSPGILGGEETEAVLDAEWAGAAAPSATLLFMSCKTTMTTAGIFLAAKAVIENNLATTMSLSYGNTEVGDASDNTYLSNLWEQATAQGETVVVAAGDAGSANSDDQAVGYASHGLAVNGFASTNYNVAAGGTDFQDYYNQLEADTGFQVANYWASANGAGDSSALSYVPETPWNDTCASSLLIYLFEGNGGPNSLCDDSNHGPTYYPTGGGGGGVSTLQPRPSWQNATVYGIPSTGTYNNRLLPDISLFAANGVMSHALDYYESDQSAQLVQAGGTSFVAPQLAGVFALIAQKTGERLGQPNYVLYSMAGAEFGTTSYLGGNNCNGSGASGAGVTTTSPASTCIFYDIETGNISQACSAGSLNCYTDMGSYGILSTSTSTAIPAYPATQGFDLATGIGSVNIANLVNNWENAAAGGASYVPTVTMNASSAAYTYGLPLAITYSATVSGVGSFPTGSVTFSGSGPIATIGNDALVESTGCSGGGSCTESATQTFTPASALPGGAYTITGAYLSTNENYLSGSGTTALTVNPQTPTVMVSAVSIAQGTATANFSASVAYMGGGIAPSGGLTFAVDSGSAVTASCTGSVSPLTCTYSGYNTSTLSVGTHTLTATSLADGNYTMASASNSLTVMPLPSITFSVANRRTMDAPFAVMATSNSSGAITYSVTSGPATIAGSTVTLTGAPGTVVLLASQAAGGGYAAGSQTASFSVIAGSVWLGNAGSKLSTFDLTGAAITGSGGFSGGGVGTIAGPLGLAFDASGNVWVASSNGVSEFSRTGVPVASAFTGGGVSNPLAVAIDGVGQVWVANSGGTVSVLNNAGAAVSPASGYSGPGSTPAGIAIDISGSVWIPSSSANTVTRILGAAAPVVPLAAGAASGTGAEP